MLKVGWGPGIFSISCISISIAPGNKLFVASKPVTLSGDQRIMISCFVGRLSIKIPRNIEILERECFSISNLVIRLLNLESSRNAAFLSPREWVWRLSLAPEASARQAAGDDRHHRSIVTSLGDQTAALTGTHHHSPPGPTESQRELNISLGLQFFGIHNWEYSQIFIGVRPKYLRDVFHRLRACRIFQYTEWYPFRFAE
jgi:hypothetical protein